MRKALLIGETANLPRLETESGVDWPTFTFYSKVMPTCLNNISAEREAFREAQPSGYRFAGAKFPCT